MNVSIATVFPHLYREFLQTSLLKRSQDMGIVTYDAIPFSFFCQPKERIDSPAVGHGSGMVIRPEIIERVVMAQESKFGPSYKIFLTPQGKKFDQKLAKQVAQRLKDVGHILFFAGRYEGIDQRAHDEYADLEISLGDFVLMGGDLGVMVILEAALRCIPGIVGKEDSVANDSFMGPFVDSPAYASPAIRSWKERSVPEELVSGDHAALEKFRKKVAVQRSVIEHFQWVRAHCVDKKDKNAVVAALPAHYVVLMHDQVLVQDGKVGTSSVTSLDIHDIARSCCTYGVKQYFLVTPLVDQQKIATTILDFWHDAGIAYNHNRAQAVDAVSIESSFENVLQKIELKEGVKPLVIATSAKKQMSRHKRITFYDQQEMWSQKRPVLFVFGTAKGLSDEFVVGCDYVLNPIEGFSDFNHLSVRSAAAIVLDRWMGCNNANVD